MKGSIDMKRVKSISAVLLILCTLFIYCGCSSDYKDDAGMEAPNYSLNENADIIAGAEDENKIKENPFVSVSENPVSTFSADVDTGSYAYIRKLINQGYSLKELQTYFGGYARTEEMVNYFSYSYSLPAENELFGTNVQIAPCPWNPENRLMILGLSTVKAAPETENNLVFLIDVSGSMSSEDKLELLKKAFSYLVSNLGSDDRVSIVTYSGKEEVVLEGCEGNKTDKIMDAVNKLDAGGSTNGEAGIKKAYEIAEKYYIQGGNNRIIMASDGDLNVGISSPEELKSLVESKRNQGVYLSVMGFGTGNYRDSNMETLADNGNGVYYYIDSETEAEKIFGTDIFSTLYTVAEDVKLQITFSPDYIKEYRLIGYENRVLSNEDFDNDLKDAGEVGAGHTVTVCYELKPVNTEVCSGEAWFRLAVRYKNPGELQSELKEYDFGSESYTETPSEDFKFISAVVQFSMILRESEFLTDDITLETVIASLDSIKLDDEYKLQFKDLLKKLSQAE